MRRRALAVRSPLHAWFPDAAALSSFRARWLGRGARAVAARDDSWRSIVPGFEDAIAMACSGVPVQSAADRRYDRSGDPRRVVHALARGGTVFLPQVHQVLPRLMRLMVALRAAFMGPLREECSFLFLTEGRGREAMGLHHDGEVEQFWLQVEGQRTVTIGRPVPRDTGQDLPLAVLRRGRWRTIALPPGSLFHLPQRTPHRVVCHEGSLAVSLTWRALDVPEALAAVMASGPAGRSPERARTPAELRAVLAGALGSGPARTWRAHAAGLTAWEVAAGQADAIPPRSPEWLWTQVPIAAAPGLGRLRGGWLAAGAELRLPAAAGRLAARLTAMPAVAPATPAPAGLDALIARGILAPRDLPLRIAPADPAALDGWRFA